MENVLIRSFLWSAFSIIRAEYRNLNAEAINRLNLRINPKYEKRQIKKPHIQTLFTRLSLQMCAILKELRVSGKVFFL